MDWPQMQTVLAEVEEARDGRWIWQDVLVHRGPVGAVAVLSDSKPTPESSRTAGRPPAVALSLLTQVGSRPRSNLACAAAFVTPLAPTAAAEGAGVGSTSAPPPAAAKASVVVDV